MYSHQINAGMKSASGVHGITWSTAYSDKNLIKFWSQFFNMSTYINYIVVPSMRR